MAQDFEGLGRHAEEVRHAVLLDELHGDFSVPLVHHHELPPGAKTAQERRVTTRDVEQRHR